MKKIVILGSTGSIGRNTLEVISRFPRHFKVVGLSANSSISALISQARRFRPRSLCVGDPRSALRVKRELGGTVNVFSGTSGLREMASQVEADMIVFAISGSAAALPLLEAVRKGRSVALANKESLVMAGEIIMREKQRHNAQILPIDSEQSAIWQCLAGNGRESLSRIYITASGGPLRKMPASSFKGLTADVILKHPKWEMGSKITVDSATLMNKGFEVIEARWLFNIGSENIKVLIHPEVVIHSMCEFRDGSIIAQMASCDMKLPIQYALSFPRRLQSIVRPVDFLKIRNLTFVKPDTGKFPCLNFAYEADREGGLAPCVLNASNEEAVNAFLSGRISFDRIPYIVEKALSRKHNKKGPDLKEILDADDWARNEARRLMS